MEKITIKTPEDAKPYIGRKVRLWYHDGKESHTRGEGTLRGPHPVGGGRHVVGVGDGGMYQCGYGGRDAVFFGGMRPEESAQIELLAGSVQIRTAADARKWEGRRVELLIGGQCPGYVGVAIWGPSYYDLTLAPLDTLADRLEAARAEVARLEAEIAREAEDARYPLPAGYRWVDSDCVQDADGFTVEIDHADSDLHISGPLEPDGTPMLSIEDPDDRGVMISARLDVVRALIARYDAQHGASDSEPYTIDIRGKWASDVSHTFQDGDVIDLTFCSGRVERATIDRVDSDGDIWIRGGYLGDCGDHSRIAGYVDGRGVIKITLVSRGAQ